MDLIKTIQLNIIQKREELFLSQDEAARLSGMGRKQWMRLENEENYIKIVHLIKVAKTLKVGVVDLFKEGQ